MVSILDDLTRVANGRGDFVVTSPTIEPLMDAATANVVLKKAAENVKGPGSRVNVSIVEAFSKTINPSKTPFIYESSFINFSIMKTLVSSLFSFSISYIFFYVWLHFSSHDSSSKSLTIKAFICI
jgi:hypothetical protein